MWLMYCLMLFAVVIQLFLITLASVAGLYYLADLVEEHTVVSRKIIKCVILVTALILIGLLVFEEMPLALIGTCLMTNLMYFFVMETFPVIELTSPKFLLSVALLAGDHYLAFSYFLSTSHSFTEVLAFFTVCVWLVPIALCISLSASDYVLPTSVMPDPRSDSDSDIVTNYFRRKGERYGLLSFLKSAEGTILPQRAKKGF